MQLEEAKLEQAPIKVTLPDGSEKPGVRLVTTPMDIAKAISKSLANNAVVAKVDGKEWDLLRPLENDCKLSLHTFADREGKEVRIDSAVVLLGDALFTREPWLPFRDLRACQARQTFRDREYGFQHD